MLQLIQTILLLVVLTGQVTVPFANAALAATGTVHGADLSWTPSVTTSTTTNVYRATISGGPYTLVTSGLAGSTYHDAGLPSSTTFYWVVTAVRSGVESAHSNEATATTL